MNTTSHPLESFPAPVALASASTAAHGSLAHLFCDDQDLGDHEFMHTVMWDCMAPRALPLFILLMNTRFFVADRELVSAVAEARTMDEVEIAIDYYWTHPSNRLWLRRVAGLRLSTQRLRRFAAGYLPLGKPRRTPRN